ncbi:hypothetical protein NQ315_006937 [Exocentrus adspersus]|uniref:SpoVT-AbrB domain-containing protein n=1 Tax=Exocentrus adspersus TaxID=1586481 RepID=A0AAV8WCX3_9CUCU|nr:hypothetical protein NQ315_006937 [Exocentrus adspersus]
MSSKKRAGARLFVNLDSVRKEFSFTPPAFYQLGQVVLPNPVEGSNEINTSGRCSNRKTRFAWINNSAYMNINTAGTVSIPPTRKKAPGKEVMVLA